MRRETWRAGETGSDSHLIPSASEGPSLLTQAPIPKTSGSSAFAVPVSRLPSSVSCFTSPLSPSPRGRGGIASEEPVRRSAGPPVSTQTQKVRMGISDAARDYRNAHCRSQPHRGPASDEHQGPYSPRRANELG